MKKIHRTNKNAAHLENSGTHAKVRHTSGFINWVDNVNSSIGNWGHQHRRLMRTLIRAQTLNGVH